MHNVYYVFYIGVYMYISYIFIYFPQILTSVYICIYIYTLEVFFFPKIEAQRSLSQGCFHEITRLPTAYRMIFWDCFSFTFYYKLCDNKQTIFHTHTPTHPLTVFGTVKWGFLTAS